MMNTEACHRLPEHLIPPPWHAEGEVPNCLTERLVRRLPSVRLHRPPSRTLSLANTPLLTTKLRKTSSPETDNRKSVTDRDKGARNTVGSDASLAGADASTRCRREGRCEISAFCGKMVEAVGVRCGDV